MAISFIGSAIASATPTADTVVTLPGGMSANDLIIAAFAVGDDDNVNTDLLQPTEGGYTEVADLSVTADADDIDLAVFYKFHNGSDTTVTWGDVGGTDAANVSVVMVFRGVKLVADGGPFDTAATTATGQNGAHPDPASIDHSGAAGIWTVIAGATSHVSFGSVVGVPYTFPSGYTTNANGTAHNGTNDASIGMGYNTAPADPEDPGVMTHDATSATNSWAAVTMALSEAAGGEPPPATYPGWDGGGVW